MDSPGKRLKAARVLMGLSRGKFATLTGMDYLRLSNVEKENARMYVDDITTLAKTFPELTNWLLFSKPLDCAEVKASDNEHIIRLLANYEANGLPEEDE
jgi:transcriptional regulator with XRE-family HTH domain